MSLSTENLPTGQVNHPSWCDRAECAVSGTHGSRPGVVDVRGLRAGVRLVQGPAVPGYPDSGIVLVELRLDIHSYESDEEEVGVVLRGDPARALGWLLVSAGREAAR